MNDAEIQKHLASLKKIQLEPNIKARILEAILEKNYTRAGFNSSDQKNSGGYMDLRLILGRFLPPKPVLAGLAVFLFALSGVSYAAEGTVPGDFLYPIKTDVNENIISAITPAGEKSNTWHLTQAKRRLAEAVILAQNNQLTPEFENTLVELFSDHVAFLYQVESASAASVTTNEKEGVTALAEETRAMATTLEVTKKSDTALRSKESFTPPPASNRKLITNQPAKADVPADFIADLENYKQMLETAQSDKAPLKMIDLVNGQLNVLKPNQTPQSEHQDGAPFRPTSLFEPAESEEGANLTTNSTNPSSKGPSETIVTKDNSKENLTSDNDPLKPVTKGPPQILPAATSLLENPSLLPLLKF
ncbi:MAG: hypothetical protein A2589_03085 [Candidatus Vogelbacteria bacterium RIFOXYD1_FULL_46_19]|uniref:DUF5667 domain-containing protein n=1 Tax=Candidatus Vogelbacteria bacterium RIFOXYD1_FULL_46_19 TaxID=1802439 RepID=A0A1G2QI72_9BACT|nr:MAG: hypothetical protein A2589_03085 [Candidatus Vogelbacteria bacterium RIFOXYD1_FULL_46_19]